METSAFIEAHVAWKIRLRKHLDGLPTDFDVNKVHDATACALGKWLASNSGNDELRKQHEAFHQCAGRVVETMKTGNAAAAKQLLNSDEYAQATSAVVKALMGISGATAPKAAVKAPASLDVNAVVVAHMEWRARLKKWITTGIADFEPGAAGRNDACTLGKWLASQPRTPQVEAVISAHDRFHRAANEVVTLQKSDSSRAIAFLDGDEFRNASSNVVNALSKLKAA